MEKSVWIGFDPREIAASVVAHYSLERHMVARVIPVRGVVLSWLRRDGLYTRPTSRRGAQLWDDISEAPMATEFAISRFLVPHLVRQQSRAPSPRWAVFMDCDMLVRANIERLFAQADPSKAVMVVKHNHNPKETVKMDGQTQTRYARKNWSSVMLFNVDHPANDALTVDLVNTVPGRDLHRFCWLEDEEIGELPPEWNYLVGHSETDEEPAIVHFTDGIPLMPGYEDCEFAGEWCAALEDWAR